MRVDNTLFDTDNSDGSKEPRYVISGDFDGTVQYMTSHGDIANVPSSPPVMQNVLKGVSATSQTLNPGRANATIGSMSFDIVDLDEVFTDFVRDQLEINDVGLRGRTFRFYLGYKTEQDGAGILDGGSTDDNPDFDNFILFQTQIVQSVNTREGGYTIHCADIQRETKTQLFDLALTYLTNSISDAATTIPVLDLSGFEGNVHGTSYTDAPSADVIYIRIDSTKEIIRCPTSGVSGNDFTGVTRGVLGTDALAVEVDQTQASDRRPKVEEYVYLELPAVKLAYAILTGDLEGTSDVLPSSWHAGVDTSFVRLTDFQNIGEDLWDTSDDNAAIVVRFEGLKKQDAKSFLETELYLLLGLFSPVYADGQLGLKRMVPSLSDSPYSFNVNDENSIGTGSLQHDMESMQNNFRIDWNWNGDRFIRSTIIVDSNSITRHGQAPEKRLKFRGLVGTRFTEQVLRQLLTSLRDMYTGPPLRLDIDGFHLMNPLEVGDACRVDVSNIRDYTQAGTNLQRTMVIHGMTVDWLKGVKLKLFGSAERADEIPPIEASTCLLDAFYAQEGTALSSVSGLMTGDITNTGTFTLTGSADMNAAASVFYHDADLTISSDTTLIIEGNVQLRVRGFITINGTIDGTGEGLAPGASLFDSGQHYYWSDDANVGNPGFIGNSQTHGGLLFRYPDEGGIPDSVWCTAGYPTEGQYQAFPNIVLKVSDAGSGSISGIPTDMRGGGGAHGPRAGQKDGLHGRTFQRADGGPGGVGGGALCIVCRGGDFGVSGQITLDGDDGVEPSSFFADPGGDYDIYGGAGGAGAPGALLWLIDGSGQTFPDIAGHFSALTGDVPAQYALPPLDNPAWCNRSLSETNSPRKNMAPFAAGPRISGYDQSGVNFRISYLPCDVTPEDDQDLLVSPPTGLATTSTFNGVRLDWVNPESAFLTVELWASDRNDRSTALKIGESIIERWIEHFEDVERGARYYWARAVDEDGNFSTFEPDTTPGVVGAPLRNRKNWCSDPEFDIGDPSDNWTGSGNGSQTDFWRANVFPNDGTASATHQPTEGEDGGVAIDLVCFGGTPIDATLSLQNKKSTRFQTDKAVFQFVIKYKTVGSIDALDHLNFLTYIRTSTTEFGGTSSFGGDQVTLPRSVDWTRVTLQQKVNSPSLNYIGWQIGLVESEFSTHDILRIDSVLVYQVGGDEFGDNVQAGDVQAGIVPKATAAESTSLLQGDGTWEARHPLTQAEDDEGLTDDDIDDSLEPGHFLRYGAVGDGSANDTDAFNAMISFSGRKYVPIPSVKYMLDSISMSGITDIYVFFEPGTIIEQRAGLADNTQMFPFAGAARVIFDGPGVTFQMPRAEYTTGGGRDLFRLNNCEDIWFFGITAKDAGGDGWNVGLRDNPAVRCYVHDCISDNCKRNGVSITAGRQIWFINHFSKDSNGDSPEKGYDIEPNPDPGTPTQTLGPLEGIHLVHCESEGNAGPGFSYAGGNLDIVGPFSISWDSCISRGDNVNFQIEASPDGEGFIGCNDCKGYDAEINGLEIKGSNIPVVWTGGCIFNPNQSANVNNRFGSAVSLYSVSGTDGEDMGNVSIKGLKVRDPDGNMLKTVTMQLVAEATSTISDVDIEIDAKGIGATLRSFEGGSHAIDTVSIKYTDRPVFAATANVGSSATPQYANQRVTNEGAAGSVNFQVNTSASQYIGNWYEFEVVAAQTLTITTDAGNEILPPNATTWASNTIGSKLRIEWDGGNWQITNQIGTWT